VGPLEGKKALVTGAGRAESIGRAIAVGLAEEGADVVINDIAHPEGLADLAQEIQALGRRCAIVMADVSRVPECRRLIEEGAAALGGLDILVNNAGAAKHQPFENVTEDDYDLMLNLHLKGPFFLAQFALPHLRASAAGRIINIASEQAYIGYADLTHYTAAKGGLLTLTKSLAHALAPAIRVNAVAPGPTATGRFKQGPEYTDAVRDLIPLKRWGQPRDVARSVVFLASDDGDAFTGQTLDPNCGTVMP
jgi:NAD(P)-dependent dehydrogenase (short-subunit alcohol dehydrogenase family)